MSNISTSSVNTPQGFQLWGTIAGRTETGQLSTYQVVPPLDYSVLNASFTGIYQGDYVRLGVATDTNPGAGYLYPANPGDEGIGVFQGCYYKDVLGNPIYSPYLLNNTVTFSPKINNVVTPTPIFCLVMDDPNALFNVQASFGSTVVSSTVPLGVTRAQIGLNADLGIGGTFTDAVNGIVTTPTKLTYLQNPANGNDRQSHLSAEYLDIATISGNQTAQFKIKQFTPDVQNGTHSYTAPNGVGYGNGLQGAFNSVLVSLNNSIYKSGIAQNYTYQTVSVGIPLGTATTGFLGMDSTRARDIPLVSPAPGNTQIYIPLSLVLTIAIPSTGAGGSAFTGGANLTALYVNGVPAATGTATQNAPVASVTSIIPTAAAGAAGSVYFPLLSTALSSGFLITNAQTSIKLNIIANTQFAGGNNAVITAYVTYLLFQV